MFVSSRGDIAAFWSDSRSEARSAALITRISYFLALGRRKDFVEEYQGTVSGQQHGLLATAAGRRRLLHTASSRLDTQKALRRCVSVSFNCSRE